MKKLALLLITSLILVTSSEAELMRGDDPLVIGGALDFPIGPREPTNVIPLVSGPTLQQPTLADRLSQLPTLVAVESLPVKVGRAMTVIFEPFRPGPSDEVRAVISGRSAVRSLTAHHVDVDIVGDSITIDIHWLGAAYRSLVSSASLESMPVHEQSCGGGAMFEPIPTAPTIGAVSEKYEIVQPLGTFSPGMYTVEVNSLGALTGTVTGTFTVYQPSPNVPLLPDPWSFVHEPVVWFGS